MIYVNDKARNFKLDNFYVIMDYDKTMTTMESDDSWTVIQNPKIMNPKLYVESMELVEKYYPLEMDYTLDAKLKSDYMYEWYTKELDLYYKYNLTYDKLISCVKSGGIILRNGLKEMLLKLRSNNIPVIILSAGIGNVIVEVLKLHNCLYDNIHIISNFFNFNNNDILPFDKTNIIHTCNKQLSTLPEILQMQIKPNSSILLFGDYIEDINMVPKKDLDKTLSFGFLEKNVDKNLEKYKNAFDIVLTDNSSFRDVQNVLNNIIKDN